MFFLWVYKNIGDVNFIKKGSIMAGGILVNPNLPYRTPIVPPLIRLPGVETKPIEEPKPTGFNQNRGKSGKENRTKFEALFK